LFRITQLEDVDSTPILFADVKGSMELAEHLDPEAWSQAGCRGDRTDSAWG